MALQTTNSFLNPASSGDQTPSVVTYRQNQLGYLQPLVSDLLTQKTLNSYTKPVYQGDPAAIKSRLGEYDVYNAGSLGGLANYFRQKAAASKGNKLWFKPEDFQSLSGSLGSVASDQLGNLTPLLGDIKPIGSVKGQTYFNQEALKNQLSKYGAVDTSTAQQMEPLMGGLVPVSSFGGSAYYDKQALMNRLNQYTSVDASGLNIPGLQDINPTATVNGRNFYTTEASNRINQLLSNYGQLPDELEAKYADTLGLSAIGSIEGRNLYDKAALDARLGQLAGQGIVDQYNAKVYGSTNINDPLTRNFWSDSMSQYNAMNAARSADLKNAAANTLFSGGVLPTGNKAFYERLPSSGASSLLGEYGNMYSQGDSLYGYTPVKNFYSSVAGSLGLSQSEMDNIARVTSGNIYRDSVGANVTPYGRSGLSSGNYGTRYANTIDTYIQNKYGKSLPADLKESIAKSGNDFFGQINQNIRSSWDAWQASQEAGNSFSSAWNSAWGPLAPYSSTLLKFTPLAPVSLVFDAAMAAENKNWGGLVATALGAYGGITGANPATDLGSYVSSGLNLGINSTPALTALGSGIIGTGTNLASGSSLGDALKSGGLSALGAYLGTSGQGVNITENPAINQALTKAALSGAGATLFGGNAQDVVRNAALGGLTSYGGNLANSMTKNLSPLYRVAAVGGLGAAMGGLSNAIRGGSFNQGASNAARRGITNAAINAALNNQLYKGLV